MSRRECSLLVADMQEAIEKIASYVDAMTFTDFQSDTRTVDAVVHNLLVISLVKHPDACLLRSNRII